MVESTQCFVFETLKSSGYWLDACSFVETLDGGSDSYSKNNSEGPSFCYFNVLDSCCMLLRETNCSIFQYRSYKLLVESKYDFIIGSPLLPSNAF